MSARFCRNPKGRSFTGGLLCQAPSEGDQPFASSPFAHPIPQSHHRACAGFIQRFLKQNRKIEFQSGFYYGYPRMDASKLKLKSTCALSAQINYYRYFIGERL